MTTTTRFKTPAPVARKINRLYLLLIKEKNLFEQVAGHITDNALRYSILSLAQQNNQYATELSAHLETTNSMKTTAHAAKKEIKTASSKNIFPDESGVLTFCNNNERKVITAYRKILDESALYEGLQKMMRYQLTGIQVACMQIKLFSSVKQIKRSRRLPVHA